MFQNILEDVTQQFLCGMTIKPLQGYFGALFNVSQRLQNPGIKESLKDIEQENNEKGGKKCLFLYHVAENKRVSQLSCHDRKEKKLYGISPGTFPHCPNNLPATLKKNGQRSPANERIVLAKTLTVNTNWTPILTQYTPLCVIKERDCFWGVHDGGEETGKGSADSVISGAALAESEVHRVVVVVVVVVVAFRAGSLQLKRLPMLSNPAGPRVQRGGSASTDI